MKYFVALALFLVTGSLTAQVEHAPTVAQCQADQRLWLSKIESGPDSELLPAYRVLSRWTTEMDDCEEVDPENKHKYYNTGAEIQAMQARRMLDFVGRHNLYRKFIEEDAAGKR